MAKKLNKYNVLAIGQLPSFW